ncbi:cellulase [Sphingomonas oleivorans]|uniref:Cellulase n=1 Tax=Sphingomonas oleivorans TaxID=1735121 RepID=A0A2T5G055_9SPHN|nr:glycoside hydrolase family 5 protein [Sphingomonas oleivorans]PTQ12342.1 cellulase [Sphingomonas oleivorans]
MARPASLLAALALLAGCAPATAAPYIGVNLSGAEYNPRRIPAKPHVDYVYPGPADLDYFLSRKLSSIRLPFRWERLQPRLRGPLDKKELARIDAVVDHVAARGGTVLLDPHNYARYRNMLIGSPGLPSAAFADFWQRLATHYAGNDRVLFGLMNEPHGISSAQWFSAAQEAIDAIRTTGARNLILVPGIAWTGAHSWFSRRGGSTNAIAFRTLSDPGDNIAVEVHQYFDHNFSGTSKSCRSATIGVEKIAPVTAWLRLHGYRGFLGEFGVSTNPVCLRALERVLAHLTKNDDVWLGWTYWAGGPWLGKYPFNVSARDGAKEETPQLKLLMRYARPR